MHSSKPTQVLDFSGKPISLDAFSISDRGLHYGDGFFTTALVLKQTIQHWAYHWRRIETSLKRLFFPELSADVLKAQLDQFIVQSLTKPYGVVKIIVTRGIGGVGYAPPKTPHPRIIFQLVTAENYPSPPVIELNHIKLCDTPVSMNSQLAGLKHLNRLENVLSRIELQDSDYDDGLLLLETGELVCGTSSNALFYLEGVWCTPLIKNGGVEGTALSFLKSQCLIEERQLFRQDCLKASAICFTNAVKGVMPVKKCMDKPLETQPVMELIEVWQQGLDRTR